MTRKATMSPGGCGIAAGLTSSERLSFMSGTRLQDHDPARRRLLRDSLVLAGGVAVAGLAGTTPPARAAADSGVLSDPHPALGRRLSRIAFGCCADQDKPQPVWDPVLARQNDLFIFLGDNIYADTRDMDLMRRKYAKLAAQPGFARLR
jgi:alkaline phosphatase D